MESREIVENVKRATVALALMNPMASPSEKAPFKIIGSGFCVHQQGIIVTCRHVLEAFVEEPIDAQIGRAEPVDGATAVRRVSNVRAYVPFAVFFRPEAGTSRIIAHCVGVRNMLVQVDSDMDLGAARLSRHEAFRHGFPVLPIEDIETVHDGLDIATCGFPKGNRLMEELGSVSSSLSRGVVSATIPSAGVGREHLKGFQLDLRATHGNSGGPVFSWTSGRVLGVLSGGISDQYGGHLFSQAESIYRLVDAGLIDQLRHPPAHLTAAKARSRR